MLAIIVFCIVNIKDKIIIKSTFITIFNAIIFGACLSAFFLFPLFEQILSDIFIVELYTDKYSIANNAPGLFDMVKYPFVSLKVLHNADGYEIFNLGYIYYFFTVIVFIFVIQKKRKQSYNVFDYRRRCLNFIFFWIDTIC